MIITRTPLRVSFAGGGSDLKEYYSRYGGSVVSVTINKYVYLSMHPYFDGDRFFLKYSRNEHVDRVEEISHRIIKKVFSDYKIRGVDFNSSADVPSGTGLGSSSAFTVGLINLCNAYTGKYMDKEKIAEYACEIEINSLKEPIGKQDQYACAVGGMNFINFHQDDTIVIEKILMRKDRYNELQKNMLIFSLGTSRSASEILKEQKQNTFNNGDTVNNLHKIVQLSRDLRYELMNGNIDSMGEILHAGWCYKKELASNITNEMIDYYYNLALKNGATGGKLLGAGRGGFLLFYVREENQEPVREALKSLKKFDFEFDGAGTVVIYYDDGGGNEFHRTD